MIGIEILAKAVSISFSWKIQGKTPTRPRKFFHTYFFFLHLAFPLCLTTSCIFSGKKQWKQKKRMRRRGIMWKQNYLLSWNDKKMPKFLKSRNHVSTGIWPMEKEFQTTAVHRGWSTPDVYSCRACAIIVQSTVTQKAEQGVFPDHLEG